MEDVTDPRALVAARWMRYERLSFLPGQFGLANTFVEMTWPEWCSIQNFFNVGGNGDLCA
eukprot:12932065-Prorocentrum_lima.AAC.1